MKLNIFLMCLIVLLASCKKDTNSDGPNGGDNWPEQPALPAVTGNAIFELEPED